MRPVRGFTLLEMAVTLLVLAVLFATGLYAFGGFYGHSQDAEAEQQLRTVAVRQQLLARDYGRYSSHPDDFATLPDGAQVVTGSSTGPDQVSVAVGTDASAALAVRSSSGQCLRMRIAPLVSGGDVTDVDDVGAGAACSGEDTLPPAVSPVPAASLTR